jgi:hypothetical protein
MFHNHPDSLPTLHGLENVQTLFRYENALAALCR